MAQKDAKKAAIEIDKIRDTPLSELTADVFLEALGAGQALQHLAFWPEKKKYELYVEPENIGRIPFDRFRDIIKGEKKKAERELPDFLDHIRWPDRFAYEQLVDRLAKDIEGRLRKQLG
jgi:hypothetical protein